jgi:hypothetical protein
MPVDNEFLRRMLRDDSVNKTIESLASVKRRHDQKKMKDLFSAASAEEEKECQEKKIVHAIIKAYLDLAHQSLNVDAVDRTMKSPKIPVALQKISNAVIGFQIKRAKPEKLAKATEDKDYEVFWYVRAILETYFEILEAAPVAAGGEGGVAQDTESEEEAGEAVGINKGFVPEVVSSKENIPVVQAMSMAVMVNQGVTAKPEMVDKETQWSPRPEVVDLSLDDD